jgi:Flp pilus assembly protein TadG
MAQIREPQEASHTSGTVAIEYALILPVMLLFTLGIMDIGRLLWTYITLTRATEAAARCGAVNTTVACPATNGACCTPIASYAATAAWGINDATAGMFTVTTPQCGGAQPGVQVAATYTFTFITPWFPSFSASAPFGAPTMTLNATACYPKQ